MWWGRDECHTGGGVDIIEYTVHVSIATCTDVDRRLLQNDSLSTAEN